MYVNIHLYLYLYLYTWVFIIINSFLRLNYCEHALKVLEFSFEYAFDRIPRNLVDVYLRLFLVVL